MMQRQGRIARLRDGAAAEYDRLHTAVWPNVRAALESAGIRNYTIFRYECWLFSCYELPEGISPDQVNARLLQDTDSNRWENLIRPLLEPLPGSGETVLWAPMTEVFHLAGHGGGECAE